MVSSHEAFSHLHLLCVGLEMLCTWIIELEIIWLAAKAKYGQVLRRFLAPEQSTTETPCTAKYYFNGDAD